MPLPTARARPLCPAVMYHQREQRLREERDAARTDAEAAAAAAAAAELKAEELKARAQGTAREIEVRTIGLICTDPRFKLFEQYS